MARSLLGTALVVASAIGAQSACHFAGSSAGGEQQTTQFAPSRHPYDDFIDFGPAESQPLASSAVVVLQARPPEAVARALVGRFFEGIASGSMREVEKTLVPEAVVVDKTGKTTSAQTAWSARVDRYDYRDTADHPAIAGSDLWVVDADDEMALSVRTLVQLEPDELLIRADVQRPMRGNQRLFADVLWFVAAAHGGSCRIRAIVEDFAFP